MPKVLPTRPVAGLVSAPRPHAHRRAKAEAARTLPALAVAAVVEPMVPVPRELPVEHLARHTPIDMGLPGEESPSRLEALFAETKWERVRRRAFRGAAVMTVLVITLGGLLFTQGYFKLHKVFRGSAAALDDNQDPDLLRGESTGRVNILLLGRGGAGHDAPDLTDTMMLASIDVVNDKTTLISLPRDLWVNVPGAGVMKLNAVFETGEFNYLGQQAPGTTDPKAIQAGYDLVDQAVEDVLGIDVHYNALVNFHAFEQAVNAVGGVRVNVPEDLVDPTMSWENGDSPVIAKSGVHDFTGAKALRYVRSRATTDDFSRTERQRAVLVALKSKVVSAGTLSNPLKLSSLIDSFGDNVDSDLSVKNAQRLYQLTKDIRSADTESVGFDKGESPLVTTGNVYGQSVVLPKAGLFEYDAIHRFIRLQLKDPFLIQENAGVLVLNGTLLPDAAKKKADELKKYGFNIAGIGNTPGAGWDKTVLIDLSGGNKKHTRNALERRVGVTASSGLSDDTIQTNGADFVIIIGNDEATPTQSQTY
ncbi:MAG TPA: LCP family protein [Candidatus Saccharimonadales bacterium]|nr:LCP family protein [Candidatus Saccharimonadales bacterium]